MNEMNTKILTIEAVAEILYCEPKTVAERLVSGDLPGVKFGRSWIIPAAALFQRLTEIALENCRKSSPPPPAPKKGGRPRFTLPT